MNKCCIVASFLRVRGGRSSERDCCPCAEVPKLTPMQTRYRPEIDREKLMPRGNPGRLTHILTGQTFGRLTVVAFYGRLTPGVLEAYRKEKRLAQLQKLPPPEFPGPNRIGQPYWRCRCECGNETIVTTWNLKRENPPHARSCGCLRAEKQRLKLSAALLVLSKLKSAQKAA